MSKFDRALNDAAVVPFPAAAAEAVADENVASIIEVLQDQLKLAREGKLRSVAVVSVSNDGSAIGKGRARSLTETSPCPSRWPGRSPSCL